MPAGPKYEYTYMRHLVCRICDIWLFERGFNSWCNHHLIFVFWFWSADLKNDYFSKLKKAPPDIAIRYKSISWRVFVRKYFPWVWQTGKYSTKSTNRLFIADVICWVVSRTGLLTPVNMSIISALLMVVQCSTYVL